MSKESKVSAEVNGSEPFAEARGYAAYGRYKVNGTRVIECLGCGVREPFKTLKQSEDFRVKHNATCHMRHISD